MNFPERGTAGWGSGKSEKVSGCSKLPPETSRAHLVPLKFPGENFPETIRNSLRLFLMATWKSGLGNDIYYIHRSVKPVKWPVADGGEEKVVFLREFF
jgi:hypothetical protein